MVIVRMVGDLSGKELIMNKKSTSVVIKLLEKIEENENLSILSRFYAMIKKRRLLKIQELKEKPEIYFINWRGK